MQTQTGSNEPKKHPYSVFIKQHISKIGVLGAPTHVEIHAMRTQISVMPSHSKFECTMRICLYVVCTC